MTPGEWEIWSGGSEANPSVIIAAKGGPPLAQTLGGNDLANGTAIAAIPNMLKALETCAARLESQHSLLSELMAVSPETNLYALRACMSENVICLNAVRGAIRNAKGETK